MTLLNQTGKIYGCFIKKERRILVVGPFYCRCLGTPGGFDGAAKASASLGAIAKIHNNRHCLIVPTSMSSTFDILTSDLFLIDRLGPKKEMMMMPLDLAPKVEDFGGKCFHLLRLARYQHWDKS